ncbi:transferring glycosyl group transferase [Trifolium pratense]|uniref:Transferring glycosyl group transferase n=1 Tax=Trifolium pratense TaxID=57577 RepID=A0A2K3N3T0_TRIPR|nr:transferring glycosyl group transferase [Trifolium pratense]PNX97654.1 transferring glycosyl group transferase [Trifolium pratense]
MCDIASIWSVGMIAHVMTFEVGAVLDDAHWQAPVYCFSEAEPEPQMLARKSSFLSLDLEPAAVLGGFRGTLMSDMR